MTSGHRSVSRRSYARVAPLSREAPPDACFGSTVFRCQLEPDGVQSVSVRLRGELDLATRGVLRTALLAAEESAALVSVDLADLEFIDCAGLATLAETAARLGRAGRSLTLLDAAGQVCRVLDLTGNPGGAERRRHDALQLLDDAEAQPAGSRHVV